jgi:hypothetical protein
VPGLVVVVAPEVVEVVAPVVDAPDVDVAPEVVVVPPVLSPLNRIAPTARSPEMSPMAMTQVIPAACCAAVGGQGYFAASVAPLPEVVQPGTVVVVTGLPEPLVHTGAELVAGGPVVPDLIVNEPENVPVDVVETMATGVQLTGM